MHAHRSREITEVQVRNAVDGNEPRTYYRFDCTCGYHASSDERPSVVRAINKHCAEASAREIAAHAGREVSK
jgi:hypothetical protein